MERARILDRDSLPRILPFAAFMGFIALAEGITWLTAGRAVSPLWQHLLYAVKTVAVATILWHYRHHYPELAWRDLRRAAPTMVSILLGLAVFVAWVNMTWPFATMGTPRGFEPALVLGRLGLWLTIAVRLCGAVVVVPIMEELFWRSFLLRYTVTADFTRVAIGTFTWPSFLASVVLFGLEHNYYLAGMLAGALYNLLLYRSKSLAQCVLAHGVTNLALGIYVLRTGKWHFW